jgi:hypothetical protein
MYGDLYTILPRFSGLLAQNARMDEMVRSFFVVQNWEWI